MKKLVGICGIGALCVAAWAARGMYRTFVDQYELIHNEYVGR